MEVRQHQQERGQYEVEFGGQDGVKPWHVPQERQPTDKPEQHEPEIRRSQHEQRDAKPPARATACP